jgi:PEP-CTERM motif
MKSKLPYIVSLLAACVVSANGATMAVNNLVGGPGDILYADSGNNLMSGGIVTMGYFDAGVTPTTIAELQTAIGLGQYTTITSTFVGDTIPVFGISYSGYASQLTDTTVPGGLVTAAPLLGRSIYSIVANDSNLSLATEFALVDLGVFVDESATEQNYYSNPAGGTVIVGTLSTITVADGRATGDGLYGTLQTVAAVPEPSTALLGALGVLALLRRRRN